jgi:hypothetical protein
MGLAWAWALSTAGLQGHEQAYALVALDMCLTYEVGSQRLDEVGERLAELLYALTEWYRAHCSHRRSCMRFESNTPHGPHAHRCACLHEPRPTGAQVSAAAFTCQGVARFDAAMRRCTVASERVRAEPKLRLAVGTLVLLHTGLPCSAGSAGHPGAAAGDSCARGVLSGPIINRPIAMAHRSLWPLNCVLWSSSGMYLAAISQRAPRAADAAHGRVHTPEYSRNPTHTVAHSPTCWPFHALTNSPSHSDRAALLFRWRFGRSFGKPTMCARRALGMRCAPTAPMAFG